MLLQNYRNPKNAAAISRYWNKSLDRSDWYKIENQGGNEAEVFIYDVVGFPFIGADEFTQDLAKITADTITVRINSTGGDVWDGLAISNSLKNHAAKIITRIEGIAASIASVIALAGDEVQINSGGMLMIHCPWVMAIGNEFELRETADVLTKIGQNILDIYHDKTGISKNEIAALMKAESWFTAAEAKQKGFADTILNGSGEQIKNAFDLSMFANVPENIRREKPKNEKMTKREIEQALRDAGASRSFALQVAAGYRDTLEKDQRDTDNDEAIQNLINKINER